MKNQFSGILPAIASPCDENDAFLESKFTELADSLYQAGVNGLYVCGATGDGYKMRLDERKRAAEIAVEVSTKYEGTVIVHVGSPSNSRDAMELAEHASQIGADAVSSVPPANCGQQQLVSYYTDVARAAGIPVFVYHIPMLTGRNPSVVEMVELLDIPGVVGLKMTDWNLFFMKRLRAARPEITVFNGFDEFLCPGLMYGANGGIGTWYNLFPGMYINIYKSVKGGNIERAMDLQNCLLAFCDIAWTNGLLQIFEYLMDKRGFGPYCFRRPRMKKDVEMLKRIEPELNKAIADIEKATK